MESVNVGVAFWGGLISFLSPCCLPLYPAYLSYITGLSLQELKAGRRTQAVRIRTLTHTLCFVAGLSLIFYVLGAGAGLLAHIFDAYAGLIRQLSGILMVLMGLFLLGVFQPQFLYKSRKLEFSARPAGYAGSLLLGIGFAAGWSPCVGPILSSIILLSAAEPGTWFTLITAYCLGFGIPFFTLAFFIGSTKRLVRYSGWMMKAGGLLIALTGVLLYMDKLSRLTVWLSGFSPDWLVL